MNKKLVNYIQDTTDDLVMNICLVNNDDIQKTLKRFENKINNVHLNFFISEIYNNFRAEKTQNVNSVSQDNIKDKDIKSSEKCISNENSDQVEDEQKIIQKDT